MDRQVVVARGQEWLIRAVIRSAFVVVGLIAAYRFAYFPIVTALGLPHLRFELTHSLTNPSVLVGHVRDDMTLFDANLLGIAVVALLLPTLTPLRLRLWALAGAFAGYAAGWWAALSVFGQSGSVDWSLWISKVGVVALVASSALVLAEPLMRLLERWLTMRRVVRVAAVASMGGIAVLGGTFVADFVGERVAQRRDRGQMRRVFRALILYEQDYDGASAASLADVAPTYVDPGELTSPADHRPIPKLGLYPANLYVTEGPGSERWVPTKISYAYARSHEPQFADLMSWDQFQQIRAGAMLANTQYRTRSLNLRTPRELVPHGPMTDSGPIIRIMNDGSMRVVPMPRLGPTPFRAFEILFMADSRGKVDWSRFGLPDRAW